MKFLSTPPGDPLTMILGRPLVERTHYASVAHAHAHKNQGFTCHLLHGRL